MRQSVSVPPEHDGKLPLGCTPALGGRIPHQLRATKCSVATPSAWRRPWDLPDCWSSNGGSTVTDLDGASAGAQCLLRAHHVTYCPLTEGRETGRGSFLTSRDSSCRRRREVLTVPDLDVDENGWRLPTLGNGGTRAADGARNQPFCFEPWAGLRFGVDVDGQSGVVCLRVQLVGG